MRKGGIVGVLTSVWSTRPKAFHYESIGRKEILMKEIRSLSLSPLSSSSFFFSLSLSHAAYQRATSASSTSSYPGSHQQQQQQQQQSQNQRQQQQQQQRASSVTSTGSPEQTRAHAIGRNYQMSHDEYRQPHPPAQHSGHHQNPPHHHHRGLSDMQEPRDHDDRGLGSRRWMDEQRSFGPPPPPSDRMPYGKQQSQPPSQHREFTSPHPPFSHPASPSQRPRTPPQHQYGASNHRPSPWDPTQTGPMSAPPSLVPRVNPNVNASSATTNNSTSALPSSGPHPHHTSPILPSLMRGSKNHSRLPSWGPHSGNVNTASRPDPPGNTAGGGNGNNTSGQHPSTAQSYRGQSVGLGEPFMRSDFGSREQHEKRKRPASESPPNGTGSGGMAQQQSSPTQRGDPMSMSSILGPSSRNTDVEKRRRLDGSAPPSNMYSSSSVKMEGGMPAVTGATSSSGPKITATNVGDSPASNLARRKWSGPIAEEAAQQAAAWRAQEQRWGSSRSPKVGLTPLAGSGGGPIPEQRRTPPIGTLPSRVEGHKRQRSDGFPTIHGSPLTRTLPLRGPSPPLEKQSHSTDSSPAGLFQPLPSTSRPGSGPAKPFGQQQPGSGANLYRPGSPPASLTSQIINQQQQPPQPQQQQQSKGLPSSVPTTHASMSYSSHPYGQPSYHAYDSQGRPVEIDVEEVRGGVFAGHGTLPPTSQEQQHGYRQGVSYNEQRHRPQAASQGRAPISPPHALPSKLSTTQPGPPVPHQQSQKTTQSNQGAAAAAARSSHAKERESKRRSMTPNAPGPAKGLLAPRVEHHRSHEEVSQRITVAMKDFNQGPKVDSEAVWETLEQVQQRWQDEGDEGVVIVDGDTDEQRQIKRRGVKTRHLGNFQYDPRKSPLLPGELLQANVGATIEIRVSGRYLGMGPLSRDDQSNQSAASSRWLLGWRAREQIAANVHNGHAFTASSDSIERGEKGKTVDEEEDAMKFWNQDALLDRKVWGTDVYTDDSDIIAMCIHAGWIQGPTLQDVPSWVPPGKATLAWRQMSKMYADQGIDKVTIESNSEKLTLDNHATKVEDEKATRLTRLQSTADLSVIVRIAPKLIAYKGSQRCGVKSRSWGNGHDGVSLVIESVTLQEPGYASGEKGLQNVKHRIDHLARLKTLATIAMDVMGGNDDNDDDDDDRLVEKIQEGGLIDIKIASRLSRNKDDESGKVFWQIDVNNGKLVR